MPSAKSAARRIKRAAPVAPVGVRNGKTSTTNGKRTADVDIKSGKGTNGKRTADVDIKNGKGINGKRTAGGDCRSLKAMNGKRTVTGQVRNEKSATNGKRTVTEEIKNGKRTIDGVISNKMANIGEEKLGKQVTNGCREVKTNGRRKLSTIELPLELLEHIFLMMDDDDRRQCKLVCRRWHTAFKSSKRLSNVYRLLINGHGKTINEMNEMFLQLIDMQHIITVHRFCFIRVDFKTDAELEFWSRLGARMSCVQFHFCSFTARTYALVMRSFDRLQSLTFNMCPVRFEYTGAGRRTVLDLSRGLACLSYLEVVAMGETYFTRHIQLLSKIVPRYLKCARLKLVSELSSPKCATALLSCLGSFGDGVSLQVSVEQPLMDRIDRCPAIKRTLSSNNLDVCVRMKSLSGRFHQSNPSAVRVTSTAYAYRLCIEKRPTSPSSAKG